MLLGLGLQTGVMGGLQQQDFNEVATTTAQGPLPPRPGYQVSLEFELLSKASLLTTSYCN
jgi:hypothetical protein